MFTCDWFTGYIPSWEMTFKTFGNPTNILEIGSFEGRSTCWLLENTDAKVTCVDTWEGSDEHDNVMKNGLFDRFNDNIKPFKDRVKIMRGESGVVLRTFPCEPTFDFVYIDGSHYSKDVLEDAVLVWRLVKPGGIIIFDDLIWAPSGNVADLSGPNTGIKAFTHIFQPRIVFIGQQLITQKP
jgi:predicted O-methyltransferase YrrM